MLCGLWVGPCVIARKGRSTAAPNPATGRGGGGEPQWAEQLLSALLNARVGFKGLDCLLHYITSIL